MTRTSLETQRAVTAREMLRHTVATVAYRGAKAVRGAPPKFANFKVSPSSRTPAQILAHIGDLFDWALAMAERGPEWHDAPPLAWDKEIARFHETLRRFDDYLASDSALKTSVERLFQGPIADALTHVGQLTMLRRCADAPIKGESYAKAEIVSGRVGPTQTPPRVEFD
jgi:hypothetical protein